MVLKTVFFVALAVFEYVIGQEHQDVCPILDLLDCAIPSMDHVLFHQAFIFDPCHNNLGTQVMGIIGFKLHSKARARGQLLRRRYILRGQSKVPCLIGLAL